MAYRHAWKIKIRWVGDLEILLFELVINKLKHSDDAAACHYP